MLSFQIGREFIFVLPRQICKRLNLGGLYPIFISLASDWYLMVTFLCLEPFTKILWKIVLTRTFTFFPLSVESYLTLIFVS